MIGCDRSDFNDAFATLPWPEDATVDVVLTEKDAVKLARKYAAIYGIDPSEFLDGYTRGKLLVKITATDAVLGPGAGL